MSTTVFQSAATITAVASGVIPKFSRVKEIADSGALKVRVASASEAADGVTVTPVDENGLVAVHLLSGADTNFGIASAAIALGAKVFAAADGELHATSAPGAIPEGYARQAAAEGDVFEWRYKPEAAVPSGE